MGRPPKLIRAKRIKDGRYLVGYVEDPGRWFQSPERSEEKAKAWASRNKARLLADPGRKLTIKPFLEKFFDPGSPWVARMRDKGHSLREKHLKNIQGLADNYMIPLFGDDDPRDPGFTARYIDDKIRAVPRHSGSPVPLAPATRHKILYNFSLFLQDLTEERIIPANPLIGIAAYTRKPVHPRDALEIEIQKRLFPPTHGGLIRIWGSSLWASCLLVLIDSGLRPGEARALTWGDLYTGDDPALMVRTGIESGTAATVKETKTETVRSGYISLRTAQELEIWRAESRHTENGDFVFTLDGKAPVTNEGIMKAFRRGLCAAGYPEKAGSGGWTPYYLRHTFVTNALDVLEDSDILLLAGHTNILTDAKYRHPKDATVLKRAKAARDKLREMESRERDS